MEKDASQPDVLICSQLDQLLALPMFCASLAFLMIAGAMLHLDEGHLFETQLGIRCSIALAFLYPLFVIEAVMHRVAGSKQMSQHGWYLVMPILRLCARDHVTGQHIWLPRLGWQKTNRRFEKRMARWFSIPMIIIALLVLPVVAGEFLWREAIVASPRLTFAMQTATGWIWMAFVFEFVIMVRIAKNKLVYCRKNWIDLAVVLLPLLSFMRAARLGSLGQLKQLSKTARVYRLRGVALRMWRAFVTLDVIDMVLRRDPAYQLEKLGEEIAEKEDELSFLRQERKRLRTKIELIQAEQAAAESAAD